MTRNEAAQKVNEAFKAAKVVEAIKDAKAKGFSVEIGDHAASYVFKHGAHAHEQRKDEVAKFRLQLVQELIELHARPALQPKPAEPVEVEEVEEEPADPEAQA